MYRIFSINNKDRCSDFNQQRPPLAEGGLPVVWGIFSWRAEKLLESRSPRPGRFRDSSNRFWETFIFALFPRIINVIKAKVDESISSIIIFVPLVAIIKPSSKRFGITAIKAIGWGQEEGMDQDTAMWKEGVRVTSFMEAQNCTKKSYLKGYLTAIKILML